MAGKVGSIQTKKSGGGTSRVATTTVSADETELLDSKKQLYRFRQLQSKVWKDMGDNMTLFHDGSFNSLKETFTLETFNKVGNTLQTDTQFVFSSIPSTTPFGKASAYSAVFNEYIEHSHRILNGFNRAINLKNVNEGQENYILTLEEQSRILNDPVKLAAWLEDMRFHTPLDVEASTTISIVLKPQYQRYVDLYGFPESGLWDSHRMSKIIIELLNNGTITTGAVFET